MQTNDKGKYMKKFSLLFLTFTYTFCSCDPMGLFTWPLTLIGGMQKTKKVQPQGKKFSYSYSGTASKVKEQVVTTDFYTFDTGLSLNWWRVRRSTLIDTGNNKDSLYNNNPRVAPGFYLGIKKLLYQSWNYPLAVEGGYYFEFCQRKDGMRTDFFDQGINITDIEIRQKVQSVRFGPRLITKIEMPHCMLGMFTQLSVALKTTSQLKVYEKSTNAFTGQSLKPYHFKIQGELGAYFKIPLKQYGALKMEYSLLLGSVKYKRKINLDVPDSNVTEEFNDQIFLSDSNVQMLPTIPSLKLKMNALSLGLEVIF